MSFDEYIESGMDAGLDDNSGVCVPCRMRLHDRCKAGAAYHAFFKAHCVCADNLHWGEGGKGDAGN